MKAHPELPTRPLSPESTSNANNTVEHNDDLGTTNWHFLEGVVGDGSLLQCLVPMTNATQRFFRVRQP